jgi:hypothetical protein
LWIHTGGTIRPTIAANGSGQVMRRLVIHASMTLTI